MTEVVLVGCTKTKREHAAEARDLYDESPLFRKRRRIARIRGDWWGILSAEHGLVRPENWLEPYDTYIGNVDSEVWAEKVLDVLLDDLARHDEPTVTIFAGKKYVDPLVPELEAEGYEVLDPLRGLMPGQRMSKLDDMAEGTDQGEMVTDGGQSTDDTERCLWCEQQRILVDHEVYESHLVSAPDGSVLSMDYGEVCSGCWDDIKQQWSESGELSKPLSTYSGGASA